MHRFSYSNEQAARLIEAVQTKASTLTKGKIFIGGEQALRWLSTYPPDILDEALDIASAWYLKSQKPLTETDYIRYTSAIMRDNFASRQKYEDIRDERRIAVLRAEWKAMSPKQQAEFPSFQDFCDISGRR